MAVFSYAKKKKTNKYIKKLKNILGVVLAIVIIVSASYIYADSYDNPYEITAYNVDITVAEDNSLHVKETITAYFNTSKHGIIRTIPLRGTLSRDDGNQSNYTAKVSNISINEKYSKSTTTDGSYLLELTIGDPSRTITGEKTYVIEYDYKYNIRNIKEYDELYYNIIGPDWDTTIDNVTFSIAMPKEFDESKLGFTYGRVNEDLTGNVEYEVNGNIVTGRLNEILEPSNAFTVRLELPEGYFSELVDYDYYYQLGCIAIFVLVIVATVIMWFKFGKDKPLVETVEFYPPDNLNSLEIGFAQKAYVTSEDITSLLIYLANKGYLKIDEFEATNQIFNTQSFKITKLKEYDGDNENERIFFNGLFKKGDEVTLSDLKYSFYTTQNRIARNINSKKNKDKILDKLSSKAQKITSIFIAITFFVISLYYVYAVSLPIFPVILFPILFMYMMYMVIKSIISCFTSKKITSIITGVILCIVIFSMMSVFLRFFLFDFGRLYAEDYIVRKTQNMHT